MRLTVFQTVTQSLRATIRLHNILPRQNRLLVAVSGGQDSLSLCEALRHLHGSAPWRGLAFAHCDHGWPHDEGNADFVRKYADKAGIPLHIIDANENHHPIPLSECAAREWRYETLTRIAVTHAYDSIVTAHTRTDLAETVLYSLANGAGADGLSSLSWSRSLAPGVTLVRPFLRISREETAAICSELSLDVWDDVYNKDERYARNRVRKHVMPLLRKSINDKVEEAFARTAHLLRDEADCLRSLSESAFKRFVEWKRDGAHGAIITLNRIGLAEEHIAITRRVVRLTLTRYAGLSHCNATFAQVEAVCALMTAPVGVSTPSLVGHSSATVVSEDLIQISVSNVLHLAGEAQEKRVQVSS